MWRRLEVDRVLAQASLSERTRLLTEVLTLGRLVSPGSVRIPSQSDQPFRSNPISRSVIPKVFDHPFCGGFA